MPAGPAGVHKQPSGLGGPSTASLPSTNEDQGQICTANALQEPVLPLKEADQTPTANTRHAQAGTAETLSAQLKQPQDISGGAASSTQEGRQRPAQHALPGASHKWAHYASSSAPSGRQYPDAKPLTALQASILPTHPAWSQEHVLPQLLHGSICLECAVGAQE